MPVLRVRITKDDHEGLDAAIQSYYRQDGDEMVLETDTTSNAERALKSERRQNEQATKLLATVVPGILEDGSSNKFRDRREWRGIVDDRMDLLSEVDGEDFDLEAYRRFTAEGDPPAESDLQRQLSESQAEARQLNRDKTRLERDMSTSQEAVKSLRGMNDQLVMDRDLALTFDSINVTDAKRRKGAVAYFKTYMDMVVEDGITMVSVDGSNVPLQEHGPDWALTEDGKSYVSAKRNSGVDDPKPTKLPIDPKAGDGGATAQQLIEAGFSQRAADGS